MRTVGAYVQQAISAVIEGVVARAVAKRDEEATIARALSTVQLNVELVQKMVAAVAASDTRKVRAACVGGTQLLTASGWWRTRVDGMCTRSL